MINSSIAANESYKQKLAQLWAERVHVMKPVYKLVHSRANGFGLCMVPGNGGMWQELPSNEAPFKSHDYAEVKAYAAKLGITWE